MKKALIKDTFKEIKNTFKRFISILLIVLLGVGFFVGIKATSPDMKKTIDKYFDDQNVMDISIISTLGLKDKDLDVLKNVKGVDNVIESFEADVIVNNGEKDFVVKAITYNDDINKVVLKKGRLPKNNDECIVESSFLYGTGYKIGDNIKIVADDILNDNGDKKKLLKNNEVKIVGIVNSPLYITMERGNSKLGSGKVNYFMYMLEDNFNNEFYTNAYIKIKNSNEIPCYDKEYEDKVKIVKDEIEKIKEERKEARYNEVFSIAENKIKDAELKLGEEKLNAENKIKDAENKINKAKNDLINGKNNLAYQRRKANKEFDNAKLKLDNSEKELINKEKEFNKMKPEAESKIKESEEKLKYLKQVNLGYKKAKEVVDSSKIRLKKLEDELATLNPIKDAERIKEIKEEIAKVKATIAITEEIILQFENTLKSEGIDPNKLDSIILSSEAKLNKAKVDLKNGENAILNGKKQIENGRNELEKTKKNTYYRLNNAEASLKKGEEEIQNNELKLEDSKKEAKNKILEAESKLEDAKLDLKEIKKPEWYILDRNQNIGYVSYLQDIDRIANIAKVFPIIFFVVAALISLTTMTRMVEEERTEIGTLKALGYNKFHIASKYVIYSFLATIIGSSIGMIIGFNIIPRIILKMYGMMYVMPDAIIEFNIKYAIIGFSVATLCTVGAAIYSCIKSLLETPASLMRPKAPKPGKRVFLERIPFIWNKFNFTKKVTARNLFRYKKRFLMTVIGVCGCTSLIIAGFGLKDAVGTMIPAQFEDLFRYTMNVSLKDNLKKNEIDKVYIDIKNMDEVEDILKINKEAIEIISIENNQPIQLIVPENIYRFDDFIKLRNPKNKKEKYVLDDEGVIINDKLADVLKLKKGDKITIKNTSDEKADVIISEITENYIQHFIYMSPELYKKLYKDDVIFNNFLGITDLSSDKEEKLGKKILDLDKDKISGVDFLSFTRDIFNDVMNNMNIVVLILIVSAGLLCLVVLYNLSNTNISERVRELATIKVLGFYDNEVYQYVSKETNILTIIGILFGIFGGMFLTTFIIKTCELDMFMFNPQIKPMTFVYGILITIIFELLVNIATYFTLKKINMIESLKSVE